MTIAVRKSMAAIVSGLASISILVALLAHSASHVLLDPGGFSGRAVELVQNGQVESLVVDTVSGRVAAALGNDPRLQPIIDQAVREVMSNGQVAADIRGAADSLQSGLVSGNATVLTLNLPDVAPLVAAKVQAQSPQLADQIRAIGTVRVVDVPIPPSASTAVHDLAYVAQDSTLLILLSAALVALALILTPDRRRTLVWLGVGTGAAGLFAAAIYLVGRGVVVNQFSAPDAQAAARAAWGIYFGGLETAGFVFAGAGVVIAGAAALL